MAPQRDPNTDENCPPACRGNALQSSATHDALLKAAQAAVRDSTRLTRLFTILSDPAPLELMLDRVLSTLSELFLADIVVLVDPAGSGSFSPLAALGLPEDMIQSPMSTAETGYMAIAMATKGSIVKTGVSLDPAVESQFRDLGVETAVWIPVIGSHATRGVLILARCHPAPFVQADVDLLAAMAYRIALALEQAQHSVQLEQMIQAGRRISRNLDEPAVCSHTVSMLPAVVGSDAAALVLRDPTGALKCVGRFGLDPTWDNQWSRLAENLLSDSGLNMFHWYSTADVLATLEAIFTKPPDSLPVRALLAVPIRRDNHLQGLLFAMRFTPVPFSPDTVQVAMLYAAQTSAALENAWLYQTMQEELAERARAERRLSESEERLHLALMGADLGMWDWNIVTGEVSFNQRWSEMLGYLPEEIEPHVRTREKLIHPDDFQNVMAALQPHLDGRTHYYETEHRFIAKSDQCVWVLDKGKVTHRDAEGRPLRFVGTCLDITEAKRIQADRLLIEQQKHQVWRSESLSRMAGGIAHHFNNLLQGVMGNLELAQVDLPQEMRSASLLRQAMEAASRASEISQLMLAYIGQKTGKIEPLDLGETVRALLPLLTSSMTKGVHLKTDLPPHGPVIKADGVHIKQILTNLVSNAVEAIGQKEGEISLKIEAMSAAEIGTSRVFPLDWDPDAGSYACLSVSDTGCGMDEETQERIFEPFFSTKFTGRGLGMPVTLGLVRSYGGSIIVESRLGRGSSVRLVFPMSEKGALPSLHEEPHVYQGDHDSRVVLVVDDDPMIRLLAEGQLQKLGYEMIEACDGIEAMEMFLARKHLIDVVLLDLCMPRMDGWATLAALRDQRADIPVVIASGYDEVEAMEGLHWEQPLAFLQKPYKLADLKLALDLAQKSLSAGCSGNA